MIDIQKDCKGGQIGFTHNRVWHHSLYQYFLLSLFFFNLYSSICIKRFVCHSVVHKKDPKRQNIAVVPEDPTP